MYAVLEATESVIANGNADVCSALRATYIYGRCRRQHKYIYHSWGPQKTMLPTVMQMHVLFLGPHARTSQYRYTCRSWGRQKEVLPVYVLFLGSHEWTALKPVQMYMPFMGPTEEEGCRWRCRCTVQQHILASAVYPWCNSAWLTGLQTPTNYKLLTS